MNLRIYAEKGIPMRYLIFLLFLLPLSSQAFNSKYNWGEWQEYKTFYDVNSMPIVIIHYKTRLTKIGIASIKWKIKNSSSLSAKKISIEQKFYQSSDGFSKVVSGDSYYAKKNKAISTGYEKEFQSDLFSSDNHGELTVIELRYPFFKAEFLLSDGSTLKVSGKDFEVPTGGLINCTEKYGQPATLASYEIEQLPDNKIKLTSSDAKSSANDLIFDLTTYLSNENKKKLEKEFKSQFASYTTRICGNKIKNTEFRDAFDTVKALFINYVKSGSKKLIIKPPSYIDGERG